MMKRTLFLLAFLPVLAQAQYIGPIYKPGGVAITGGTINGTTVGATTRASGAFTTLAANGALTTSSLVGLGSATSSDTGVNIQPTLLTSGTTQYGVYVSFKPASDSTVGVNAITSLGATANASYTTTLWRGYYARNVTLQGSSLITNLVAYDMDDLTSGGTLNIGYRSLVSSGTGKWNFYASGTAANYMAGALALGSTALTVPAGGLGMAKITADGAAPGAGGAKLQLVCGTNAGTAKLVISAGTSATTITITDNIGAGVSGC